MTDFVFRNIDNSAGSATISDHGAHLLRWRPLSQATDVVFAPSSVVVAEGRPLGGGVPVIFPWFGPGFADGHGLGKSRIMDSFVPDSGISMLSPSAIAMRITA